MKASELVAALEEFQTKLAEHRELWAQSLDAIVPSHPVRNFRSLEEQSSWLSRKIGALRSYIDRFDRTWVMQHPATGVTWNALEAATGLTAVGPIKVPSINTIVQKLNQIIGHLQTLDSFEEIPADPNKPIRPGLTADRIMLVYLDHLHPFIARGCSQLYRDGHYPQAVEEAAKAAFQYIRDLAGDGTTLVQTAFSLKKPVLAFSDLADSTKQNEQQGFMEMVCGFTKGFAIH